MPEKLLILCADIKNAFHQMRNPEWLLAFSAPLTPDSLIFPVPTTLSIGLSWAKFFCQDVTDHWALAGSTEYPILFVVTTLLPRCSVAYMAWDPSASAGRLLTIVGFGLALQTALTFISHVVLWVYRRPVLMCTTYLLPAEVQMFSTITSQRVFQCNGQPDITFFGQSRGRSLCAVALLAVGRWSSSMVTSPFLALSNRGGSLKPCCKLHVRAAHLVSGEPWSTVRLDHGAFGRILCLLRSDWSLRRLDVCICTDALLYGGIGKALCVRDS